MTTIPLTQQNLLVEHGWRFVPSHDIKSMRGFNDIVIPECWVHLDYPVQWTLSDVLAIIGDEKSRPIPL